VTAPSITDDARDILSASPNLRVLINPALDGMDEGSLDQAKRFKYVRGDMMLQDNYTFVADLDNPDLEIWGEEVGEQEKDDMLLAWAIGSTSPSNTITIVKGGRLLANGVGQQARHIAAWLATSRGDQLGHDLEGAVAYSDSYFPKSDGAQILIEAGVRVIFGLRGSNQDEQVKEDILAAGGTQYTLPNSKARGFYHP
jgi:phosphoribosylaminoimidazolecarboxamide formyltransferase/IMP cyclohydrolase